MTDKVDLDLGKKQVLQPFHVIVYFKKIALTFVEIQPFVLLD